MIVRVGRGRAARNMPDNYLYGCADSPACLSSFATACYRNHTLPSRRLLLEASMVVGVSMGLCIPSKRT
jgi:hypothetical protein